MSGAGNPLVLATPTQRDPVERQAHAVERLKSCWHLIDVEEDRSNSADDILDLVESLQDDLEPPGAPDLPLQVRKTKEVLLHFADQLKAKEIDDNWDATSTTVVSAGATTKWTAQEVENEVDRRLHTDEKWRYRPLARDPRSTPKRLMRSLWRRHHEAWELDTMPEKAEEHYLSLWRANEPFRDGVDPQQSPFAEILRNPDSTEDNVIWRKVRDIKGGAQGKISLWRMTRQDGRQLRVILKDTSENEFFMDYCSEAFLTLRLNAAGCQNVIKVLDWSYYDDAGKRRFQICYEWAKYGDLSDLVGWYYDNGLILPEAFIWHVFNSLARALVYCRYGRESEMRADQWEELVCGDLKEANTLVCEPDHEHKIYPCLKLADFGLAYPIPSKEVRDFKQATPWGTSGYQAPEIQLGKELVKKQLDRHSAVRRQRVEGGVPRMSPTFDAADSRAQLGSHSDIWSLAATISNLMSLVNQHLRTKDVRELWRHRLKRCYYSEVLVGLVETCLNDDYTQRLIAYDLYEITSYYAAQHRHRVYSAAEYATSTGQPSYYQEVLLGGRQDKFQDDVQFGEQYAAMNLNDLHSLQDSLRGHNKVHLHPNEVIKPPQRIYLGDIISAARLRYPPPAHLLERPFRFGYKRLISGTDPVESNQDDTDNEDYPTGVAPLDPRTSHDGAPPTHQPGAVDDQAPHVRGNVSRARRPYPAPRSPHDSAPPAQQPPQQTAVDDQAPRVGSRARRPYPAPLPPHDGAHPTKQPPQQAAVDEQAPRAQGNVSRPRRPYPAPVRSPDSFAAFEPATLQRSPGSGDRPIGRRLRMVIDEQASIVSNIPPTNSRTHLAPLANESIDEQAGPAAQTELITPGVSNQPHQSLPDNEAPTPDSFYSVPPPPRNDASAPSLPPTQAITSNAPQPQPNDHPHRAPSPDEAELPNPFYSAPPPPRNDNPAPPPPPTQTAAPDAPPPQSPAYSSTIPAVPIPAVPTQQAFPPASAPATQPTSQRSSTSSGLSSVPPGPIRTPSPRHRARPSTAPPPPSSHSSPLSSVPSPWPYSPPPDHQAHAQASSTASSPLTPVPPGPITRPLSALEERYLFRHAPRPARLVALQRIRQAGRVGRRKGKRGVVEVEEVQEVDAEEGRESKAERQVGERDARARKRRRG